MSPVNEDPRPVSGFELSLLRKKYERMAILRELHVRANADPSFIEPDPREEMAALAEEFPGVLREIDELPLEVIRDRIAALVAAEADPSQAELWMIAQARFHRLARGALVVKRWLSGTKIVTPAVEASFSSALDGLSRADDARLWEDHLAEIAAPPRGRLMDVVHARVSVELSVTDEEARRLVFGTPRRTR